MVSSIDSAYRDLANRYERSWPRPVRDPELASPSSGAPAGAAGSTSAGGPSATSFDPASVDGGATEPANVSAPAATQSSSGSFADVLGDAITQARALEGGATQAAEKLARGEGGIHEVMIAQEKASISVRYAVTMKNRALEAYKEILQTQI